MDRWLARIAAGSTGLTGGLAVSLISNGRPTLAAFAAVAALFSALWWIAERRLDDMAQQRHASDDVNLGSRRRLTEEARARMEGP